MNLVYKVEPYRHSSIVDVATDDVDRMDQMESVTASLVVYLRVVRALSLARKVEECNY